MNYLDVQKELLKFASLEKAKQSSWFFKTGEGQYGYGDEFIGVTVPEQRIVAKKFITLALTEIEKLLHSKIHEERLTALLILVGKYTKEKDLQKDIFEFYLKNTKFINNWDLVDSSADKIVGQYLIDHQKGDISLLIDLSGSVSLWERRIAMIATFQFLKISKNNEPTFEIAVKLLADRNDLIQKAVGWMLRESGKKVSQKDLEEFLIKNYKHMGRTALRYSIERLSPERKKEYLAGTI